MTSEPWSVIILTGGTSRRMGRDKARLTVSGMRLIDRVLASVPDDVPVVIVGPDPQSHRPVDITREEPLGAGPAAAIAAGLRRTHAPIVVVCAVDMPFAGPLLAPLAAALRALPMQTDAVIPVLDERPQPLCAAYRTESLRRRADALGSPAGASVRDLVAGLQWQAADDLPIQRLMDVDTPSSLVAARDAARLIMDTHQEVLMDEWIAAVAAELGVSADVAVDVVLDVARDAAHQVQRPAAPITTYLLGLAVAAGMAPEDAGAKVHDLALQWSATHSDD